jgi:hypothetical protein
MPSEPRSGDEAHHERRPPKKRPAIVRVFRALKRYQNRYIRRDQKLASDHQINERLMARWTRHVGLFTGALVLVGIASAIIFWRQLNVMQRQLDEMQAEQRPWVSAAAAITEPFVYEYVPNGTTISLAYKLHNSGHSPANNVWIELAAFPQQPDGDLLAAAEGVCKDRPAVPGARVALGFTIFPDETVVIDWGSSITKTEIDALNSKYAKVITGPMNIWTPTIIACIVYRSPTEGGRIHHTPLILNLRMKRGSLKPDRGCCAIFIDDSPIPAEKLEVERMIISLPAD